MRTEYIRKQLSNRASNVMNSDEINLHVESKIFFKYIEENKLCSSVLDELKKVSFNFEDWLDNEKGPTFPKNHLHKIYVCYCVMNAIANEDIDCMSEIFNDISESNTNERSKKVAIKFFQPIYQYFDEQILHGSFILYLLYKYKYRTEWFCKSKLYDNYMENTKKGEDTLTLDLLEYLHDQGIDYPFATPHSPSGRADLVGHLDSQEPLVSEVKIFNIKQGYDKNRIRQGVIQAYKYLNDYNKLIGYLIIFKTDENEIIFDKSSSDNGYKSIEINNKTIYIITVDIYPNAETASKTKTLKPYIITDTFLEDIKQS